MRRTLSMRSPIAGGSLPLVLTSGVVTLVGLGITGLVFLLMSARRGVGSAYLAVCWVPMALLSWVYVMQSHLGYSALAILAVVTVTSLALLTLGVVLCVRARRMEPRNANRLAVGTVVASLPALLLIASVFWTRAH